MADWDSGSCANCGTTRGTSRTLKVVDADGVTHEVWHEAFSAAGVLRHRHLIYQRPEEPSP